MTNKTVHRGMSSEKWESLKPVGVKSRYVWVSCAARMLKIPQKDVDGNLTGIVSAVPYIQKPGNTYRKKNLYQAAYS